MGQRIYISSSPPSHLKVFMANSFYSYAIFFFIKRQPPPPPTSTTTTTKICPLDWSADGTFTMARIYSRHHLQITLVQLLLLLFVGQLKNCFVVKSLAKIVCVKVLPQPQPNRTTQQDFLLFVFSLKKNFFLANSSNSILGSNGPEKILVLVIVKDLVIIIIIIFLSIPKASLYITVSF